MSGFLRVRLYESLDKKTPAMFGTLYPLHTGVGEVSLVLGALDPLKTNATVRSRKVSKQCL